MSRPLTLRDTYRLFSRKKIQLQRNMNENDTCIHTPVKGEQAHLCQCIDGLWDKKILQTNLDRWVTQAGPNALLEDFIHPKQEPQPQNGEQQPDNNNSQPNKEEQDSSCQKNPQEPGEFLPPEPKKSEKKQSFKDLAKQKSSGQQGSKGPTGQTQNSPQGGSSSADAANSGSRSTPQGGPVNGGGAGGPKGPLQPGTAEGDVKSNSSPSPKGKDKSQGAKAKPQKSQESGSENVEMGPHAEGIDPKHRNDLLKELGKLLAGDTSSTGTSGAAGQPHDTMSKTAMAPISLEARYAPGGNYLNVENARLQSKEERRLARQIYLYLKRLLEKKVAVFGEQSPRWDHRKLIKELVSKSGSLVRCRRREIEHEIILLLSDVSGSCASTCNATMAACFAIAEQDERILIIAHSNGQPVELFGHQAKTYEKAFKIVTSQGDENFGNLPKAWFQLLGKLPPIAGIMAFGDWDAVNSYRSMCEFGSKFFWLDPMNPTFYGKTTEKDVRPILKEHAQRYQDWKKKPLVHMIGVTDANTGAIALRRMHKMGGSIYEYQEVKNEHLRNK